MKKVFISDITLTEVGKAEDEMLSFKEKIEIARHLSNLHIDAIELPTLKNVRTDTLLLRTISSFVKDSTISLNAGMSTDSADAAWNALSGVNKPRLRVELPVSPVQMEYCCHLKAPAIAELCVKLTEKCASLCHDVEFCAKDATRADKAFLAEILNAAVKAGATSVTLCDNDATMLPDEFGAFVSEIKAAAPSLDNVRLGVMVENKYGLALASSVAAIKAGAEEIKTAIATGELLSFDDTVNLLRNCERKMDICTTIGFEEATRLSSQIAKIVKGASNQSVNSAITISQFNSPSEISLTGNDNITAVSAAVKKLGYDLSEEDTAKVFEAFKRVADKKSVTFKELDAIIASSAMQVPPTYRLISYVINNGNLIGATAYIKLDRDGIQFDGMSAGDGPIDASFRAIEQIVGHHYELDDFQIQSVTEGHEAMGNTIVKLRNCGKLYSGNGISTDIIGSSIRAYMSALNKIKYEES